MIRKTDVVETESGDMFVIAEFIFNPVKKELFIKLHDCLIQFEDDHK